MRAWRVHQYGRPSEALRLDDIDEPVPEPGKIRVAPQRAVVNFNVNDGCHGPYRTVTPDVPYTLGLEVVG
ncbi:MAG: NADPH:quinone oxidoreductase family protein, partial [bacterium]|nr:NADPH:quinone oxidoreductase family protein [bacterium]